MVALIRPVQDQGSQDSSTETGGAHEPPPLTEGWPQLTPSGGIRESLFLKGVAPGEVNHDLTWR